MYITDPKGAQFGLFKTDTDRSDFTMCGQRFNTEDGHEVVLVQNSSTALDSGVLVQQAPVDTNFEDLTVVTFTPLDPSTGIPASLTVTVGAVANENIYAGGLLYVTAGTGIGQTLRITSSTATASGSDMTVVLEDSPAIALDTSSTVTLTLPNYTGVVIGTGTTATAEPAGVTLYPISASVDNTYDGTSGKITVLGSPVFGFIVTKGRVACLSDSSPATIGQKVVPSTSVAGAVTTSANHTAQVGIAVITGVSAESQPISVNL